MICKYWTEYGEEYCKLAKKMCMCGAEQKNCNYAYLLPISQCPHCYCMTKTIDGKCGKCKNDKD